MGHFLVSQNIVLTYWKSFRSISVKKLLVL